MVTVIHKDNILMFRNVDKSLTEAFKLIPIGEWAEVNKQLYKVFYDVKNQTFIYSQARNKLYIKPLNRW